MTPSPKLKAKVIELLLWIWWRNNIKSVITESEKNIIHWVSIVGLVLEIWVFFLIKKYSLIMDFCLFVISRVDSSFTFMTNWFYDNMKFKKEMIMGYIDTEEHPLLIVNRNVTFREGGSHRFHRKSWESKRKKSLKCERKKESGTCQSSSE